MAPNLYLEMIEAEDPHPLLHRLRAEDPVHWVEPLGFWFVTRHDDAKRLMHEPETVTPDHRGWEKHEPPAAGTFSRWAEDNGLFSISLEDHNRIRGLVAAAFKPAAVRRMENQIHEVVQRVAKPLIGRHGDVIDMVSKFTHVVPAAVIGQLTGVADGETDARFRRLTEAAVSGVVLFSSAEAIELGVRSYDELRAWITETIALRRTEPQEDLVSDLVLALHSDPSLTEYDVIALLIAIIGAGIEVTKNAGTMMIKTMLRETEALNRLRADRALIHKAINEILRFSTGSVSGVTRFAIRDFQLRRKQVRRGQMLMLSAGGANRDPSVYPDPDKLDLNRNVRSPLTFGFGPHYCLGDSLSRVELGWMLDSILDILPPGSFVRKDKIEFLEEGHFKRPLNLPIEIGPAP